MTLGLPLMLLVLIGISAVGASTVFTDVLKHRREGIGLVDPGHAVEIRPSTESALHAHIVQYRDAAQGKADVKRGLIDRLVVLDRDYVRNGRADLYTKGSGLFGRGDAVSVRALLVGGLLARTNATPDLAHRVVAPTEGGLATYEWSSHKHEFARRTGTADVAGFLVPYLFGLLLMVTILVSASYLLRGIADEKESRVIEVILSSVTAEDLLRGKLIGLAGVGLTQVGIWVALGGIPAILILGTVTSVTPLMLAETVVYFVLGFGLYATVLAGLGALGTSQRETQQTLGMVSMAAYFPFLLITVILQYPNGTLARVLSFVPFTAPTTMVLRLTSADVPAADIAISIAAIAASIWLLNKLSARLFRMGLLIYGKRPSLREVLRWLREA